MARTNFTVSSELQNAFINAQSAGTSLRTIVARIREAEIVMESANEFSGSLKDDFQRHIVGNIKTDTASYYLFCVAENCSIEDKKWLFLCWIPDSCKVRDKMLYSSSSEDVKQTLGLSYFTSNISATSREELDWGYVSDAINGVKSDFSSVLTSTEKLVKEEQALCRSETSVLKANAMGVLPFNFEVNTLQEFMVFRNSVNEVRVELSLQGENVILHPTVKTVEFASVFPAEPRFFLVRKFQLSNKCDIFVYYCPEDTAIRSKMTMSSAKATVLAKINESGVQFDKSIEVRDGNDLDYMIQQAFDDVVGAAGGGSDSLVSAESLSPKPTRGPTGARSRPKVAKFVADE